MHTHSYRMLSRVVLYAITRRSRTSKPDTYSSDKSAPKANIILLRDARTDALDLNMALPLAEVWNRTQTSIKGNIHEFDLA